MNNKVTSTVKKEDLFSCTEKSRASISSQEQERDYRIFIRNTALNAFKQKFPNGVKMMKGAKFLK